MRTAEIPAGPREHRRVPARLRDGRGAQPRHRRGGRARRRARPARTRARSATSTRPTWTRRRSRRRGSSRSAPTLARIAALADARALAAELGATVRADVDIFNCTNLDDPRPLGVWVEQDLERAVAQHRLPRAGRPRAAGSRLLPRHRRRGMAEIRGKYHAHLEKVLRARRARRTPRPRAQRVLAFETKLAATHGVARGRRATCRRGTTRGRAPSWSGGRRAWTGSAFLARGRARGAAGVHRLAARRRHRARRAREERAARDLEGLPRRRARSSAPRRSSRRRFADEAFAFHGTALTGTPQQRARWKRGLGVVDGALGEAVGRIYVERHFPPEAKAEIRRW